MFLASCGVAPCPVMAPRPIGSACNCVACQHHPSQLPKHVRLPPRFDQPCTYMFGKIRVLDRIHDICLLEMDIQRASFICGHRLADQRLRQIQNCNVANVLIPDAQMNSQLVPSLRGWHNCSRVKRR
jgi:hypothetical protein